MYLITIEKMFHGKTKDWRWDGVTNILSFPTEKDRDEIFEEMKQTASKSGCGGMCDCFADYGQYYKHCFGVKVTKNTNLSLQTKQQ